MSAEDERFMTMTAGALVERLESLPNLGDDERALLVRLRAMPRRQSIKVIPGAVSGFLREAKP